MNALKRTVSILLLAVIAGFVVFILVSNQRGDRRADSDILPEVDPNNRKQSPVVEDGSDSNDKEYFKLVTPEEEALRPEEVSRGAWAHAISELRARGKMNGEVKFFGKIVDENGDPLSDVRVEAELLTYETSIPKLLSSSESLPRKTFELVSDAEGKISVVEPLGSRLKLRNFRKEGYKLFERTYFVFPFGNDKSKPPHVGDPDSPEIFTMKKVE